MLSLATLLHVGTLISVFVVMRREIGAILRDIFAKKTWLLLVATVPAVLAALLLGDWIDRLFGGGMLGYSFLATAVILCISLLWRRKSDPDSEIGYPEALIGGIGQRWLLYRAFRDPVRPLPRCCSAAFSGKKPSVFLS